MPPEGSGHRNGASFHWRLRLVPNCPSRTEGAGYPRHPAKSRGGPHIVCLPVETVDRARRSAPLLWPTLRKRPGHQRAETSPPGAVPLPWLSERFRPAAFPRQGERFLPGPVPNVCSLPWRPPFLRKRTAGAHSCSEVWKPALAGGPMLRMTRQGRGCRCSWFRNNDRPGRFVFRQRDSSPAITGRSRMKSKSIWRAYSYAWITLGLFVFSIVGHWIFGWYAF